MKLNDNNARFAVVYNAFHCGGVVSRHMTLAAAEAGLHRARIRGCQCGCAAVVPIKEEAADNMRLAGYIDIPPLLADIPEYTGAEVSPYVLRR